MILNTELSVVNSDGGMQEIPVTVTYTIIPGSRGYRNSMGVPEEPDESRELVIESIVDANDTDWIELITHTQLTDLMDECMSDMSDY